MNAPTPSTRPFSDAPADAGEAAAGAEATGAGATGAGATGVDEAQRVGSLLSAAIAGSADAPASPDDPSMRAAREAVFRVVRKYRDVDDLVRTPVMEELVAAVAETVFGPDSRLAGPAAGEVARTFWGDANSRGRMLRAWQELKRRADAAERTSASERSSEVVP